MGDIFISYEHISIFRLADVVVIIFKKYVVRIHYAFTRNKIFSHDIYLLHALMIMIFSNQSYDHAFTTFNFPHMVYLIDSHHIDDSIYIPFFPRLTGHARHFFRLEGEGHTIH